MFLFFLFISQSQAITPISLDSQFKWMTSDSVTKENIYSIPNNSQQQYYLNVTLEQQDPEFQLIVTLGQPFNRFNNTVTNYFDWIRQREYNYCSQLENRLTRFIKFQPQEQDIYITTIGNIIQQYNISIIATDNDLCQNDCNNNGICKNKGRKCNQFYIGNDCHQKAQQILLNEENQYPLKADEINYLYISEEDQRSIGGTINFTLESNNPNKTIFLIEKEILLVNQFEKQPTHYNEYLNQPLIFLVKSLGYNSILTIGRNSHSESSSQLAYIIGGSVGGGILFIANIGYLIRRCYLKKQKAKETKEGELQFSPALQEVEKNGQAYKAIAFQATTPSQNKVNNEENA